MFSSLIFPWPRRSLNISCSLSPSCENTKTIARDCATLFLWCRGRGGLHSSSAFFDPESPVRLDFLVARFSAKNYRAALLSQLLRHLIRNDARLGVKAGRN